MDTVTTLLSEIPSGAWALLSAHPGTFIALVVGWSLPHPVWLHNLWAAVAPWLISKVTAAVTPTPTVA